MRGIRDFCDWGLVGQMLLVFATAAGFMYVGYLAICFLVDKL